MSEEFEVESLDVKNFTYKFPEIVGDGAETVQLKFLFGLDDRVMTYNEDEKSIMVKIDTSEKDWDTSYILKLRLTNEDGENSGEYTLTLKVTNKIPVPIEVIPVNDRLAMYFEEMENLKKFNDNMDQLDNSGFWKVPDLEDDRELRVEL